MVAFQILDRGQRALPVECVTLVRHREIERLPPTKNTKRIGDGRDRILAVLYEVVGDHEVLRGVRDRGQLLAVVDDVGLDQLLLCQLGIVGSKLRHRLPVDVHDQHTRRNLERHLQRTNLDAAAADPARRQLPPNKLEWRPLARATSGEHAARTRR